MSGGRKAGAGYTLNNEAKLLKSGSEFFETLVHLVDSAKEEIHFQTYIFEEDETGKGIAKALIRAARRGVKIFLLLDAYGSGSLSANFLRSLSDAGVEFRWFGPLFTKGSFHIGRRLHRKVVVVDGLYSLVSGINISDNYNDQPGDPAWLDFGVLLAGEISESIYLICRQSWLKIRFKRLSRLLKENIRRKTLTFDSRVKIRVRQNDRKLGKKQASASYYRLIRHARESLVIVGGYFLPGRKARKLLKKASGRGVSVSLLVAERSDVGLMRNAMLYLYDWLLRNKIHIYEYRRSNVHGKAMIADGKICATGSCDLNALSAYSNIELNVEIDDESFSGQFNELLKQVIHEDCVEIVEARYKSVTPAWKRLIRWSCYRLVKILFVLSVWLAKEDKNVPYQ